MKAEKHTEEFFLEPSADVATSYIAAVKTMEFASYTPVEYEYCISTGTTDEMRANFAQVKDDMK